jgi:hypothetical protein
VRLVWFQCTDQVAVEVDTMKTDDAFTVDVGAGERALKTGNMAIIRSAAGELPQSTSATLSRSASSFARPSRVGSNARRCGWLARFCVERCEATLTEVQAAAWAFENITDEPAALATLQRLCSR